MGFRCKNKTETNINHSHKHSHTQLHNLQHTVTEHSFFLESKTYSMQLCKRNYFFYRGRMWHMYWNHIELLTFTLFYLFFLDYFVFVYAKLTMTMQNFLPRRCKFDRFQLKWTVSAKEVWIVDDEKKI